MKEHIAAVVASWEKKEREDMEIDGLSPRVQGHLVDMLFEAFVGIDLAQETSVATKPSRSKVKGS